MRTLELVYTPNALRMDPEVLKLQSAAADLAKEIVRVIGPHNIGMQAMAINMVVYGLSHSSDFRSSLSSSLSILENGQRIGIERIYIRTVEAE